MISIFDTNILIDYFNGVPEAAITLNGAEQCAISRVVWIELLAGVGDGEEEENIRRSISHLTIHEVTPKIAERAILVRRERRLKLPDAIIYATALEVQGELVTRNTKDFSLDDSIVRVPYHL